jgi:hypothetical protein
MKAVTHLWINAIAGIVILSLIDELSFLNFLLFQVGGILVDIDHVIYHVVSERNISFKEFVRIHKKLFKTMTPKFYFFHTFEVIALLCWLSLYLPSLQVMMLGYLVHMACDIIKYMYVCRNFAWAKHWFLVWNLFNLRSQ